MHRISGKHVVVQISLLYPRVHGIVDRPSSGKYAVIIPYTSDDGATSDFAYRALHSTMPYRRPSLLPDADNYYATLSELGGETSGPQIYNNLELSTGHPRIASNSNIVAAHIVTQGQNYTFSNTVPPLLQPFRGIHTNDTLLGEARSFATQGSADYANLAHTTAASSSTGDNALSASLSTMPDEIPAWPRHPNSQMQPAHHSRSGDSVTLRHQCLPVRREHSDYRNLIPLAATRSFQPSDVSVPRDNPSLSYFCGNNQHPHLSYAYKPGPMVDLLETIDYRRAQVPQVYTDAWPVFNIDSSAPGIATHAQENRLASPQFDIRCQDMLGFSEVHLNPELFGSTARFPSQMQSVGTAAPVPYAQRCDGSQPVTGDRIPEHGLVSPSAYIFPDARSTANLSCGMYMHDIFCGPDGSMFPSPSTSASMIHCDDNIEAAYQPKTSPGVAYDLFQKPPSAIPNNTYVSADVDCSLTLARQVSDHRGNNVAPLQSSAVQRHASGREAAVISPVSSATQSTLKESFATITKSCQTPPR
ncbi:uncharacterized protein FIBRA_02890 [Fibroporia radiculosa]|uniref:Uncharacterized protein n=1 Tax=Fibroporia radiculosa TaxID=599839 RepID=J4HVN6_9APHY|nr:uncharacterized protein FIBRA_02890 [Fibroporia radiculosa]CCM00847.1 predicted protein [Fibroporia radiculosa]